MIQLLSRMQSLLCLFFCLTISQAFSVTRRRSASQRRQAAHLTLCCAKQKQKSAPARGFGSSSSPASAQKPAVRSLSSGQSGSGTKVLRKAANLFDAIRKECGVAACSDVYVRSPSNSATTFWFVGKIAYRNGATALQAALAQKRLIFEYSKLELRPQNFGGPFSKGLELWLAPGDSEMDTVQNKVALEPVAGSASNLPGDFDLNNIGYNPEIYVGDEAAQGGLRVQRDDQGQPIKATFDVNKSA